MLLLPGGRLGPKIALSKRLPALIKALAGLANSRGKLYNDGAGVLSYMGGWEDIPVPAFSAASQVNVTGLSAFVELRGTLYLTVGTANAIMAIRVSANGLSTVYGGASDYDYNYYAAIAGTGGGGQGSVDRFLLHTDGVYDGASGGFLKSNFTISQFNKAVASPFMTTYGMINASPARIIGIDWAKHTTAIALDSFRLLPSTGTMTGYLILEGIRG